MLHTGHRLSKDIDVFIDDPQFVTFLSPRLAGETIWQCTAYTESANHLRLVYPEGEIDFIVADNITGLPPERKIIQAGDAELDSSATIIDVEHPAEIALKKLAYRGAMLKVRDVFDIAVVDAEFSSALRGELHHVAALKPAILARLAAIPEDFLSRELDALDIASRWRNVAANCLAHMRTIADSIPE